MRLLYCLALFALAAPAGAADARKPNVIVILSDDVGWGEFGFQGNTQIPTPNIDSIAQNGIRFTNGYIAATYCSPCRAGLMTGRYPTRFGHEFIGCGPLATRPAPSANGTWAALRRTSPRPVASTSSMAPSPTRPSSTRPTSS